MSDDGLIDRLAEAHGIAPSYQDIEGNLRQASPATKRALLSAIGVACADRAEIAESLIQVERRRWGRMLAPAVTADAGQPTEVPLRLPLGFTGGTLLWHLACEDGGTHEGRLELGDLRVLARGRLQGNDFIELALPLPSDIAPGYHRLNVVATSGLDASTLLIAAPARCFDPAEVLPGGKGWGLAAQLYGIYGEQDRGLGDFTELGRLVEAAAGLGASTVGLNPLHALFPADPQHCGPYSPSNRRFLNLLYIDTGAIEGGAESTAAAAMLGDEGLVDYPAVARRQLVALGQAFEAFRRRHLGPAPSRLGWAFRSRLSRDGALLRHAVFDALHEHFFSRDSSRWDWHGWPLPYRDCHSHAVAEFQEGHRERVEFFAWCQWIAERQLGSAAEQAKDTSLGLGLYLDLAVAEHPGGSAAWADPELMMSGANVGAPPDVFNPHGQNWGLTSPSPSGLVERAFQPFIELLRANMRNAGALRIDHVMSLQRLFFIPDGGTAGDGGYLAYPFRDLVRIVTLESQRQNCAVIGEDLGTVPEGFRDVMAAHGILSYRLLWFERHKDGSFIAPADYPAEALLAVSTHDMPTIKGFWSGHDLEVRHRLALYRDPDQAESSVRERVADRQAILRELKAAGLIAKQEEEPNHETLVEALHRWLARAPGKLLMIQLEDLAGEREQANLPGTTEGHPNWRRRLSLPVDRLLASPEVKRFAAAVSQERARG